MSTLTSSYPMGREQRMLQDIDKLSGVTKAMKQSKDKGFLDTISSGLVVDSLGIVVHGFGMPVANGKVDPGKNALLVSFEHPCKLLHRFEMTVSGPPEPPVEEFPHLLFSLIIPEFLKSSSIFCR